ncbi:MAG: DUF927 domain-containing protein [Candidatus Brocadiae bacterium]|nr:DUF927 domain-containing protein [Candidatus Brocadiia bacterium]
MNQIKYISISDLKPHPLNASIYSDGCDQELLDDIKERGIRSPIEATKSLLIVSGHRRFNAAQMLKLSEVPVIFSDVDENDELAVEEALIKANIQRQKTAEQVAREYARLKEIEKEKARRRMLEAGKSNSGLKSLNGPTVNLPQGIETGESREIAAKKLGISASNAERSAKVIAQIDTLKQQGQIEKAEQLRKTLNEKSVNAAWQQIKPKNEEQEPEKPEEKKREESPRPLKCLCPDWYMENVPAHIKEFFINPILKKRYWIEAQTARKEFPIPGIEWKDLEKFYGNVEAARFFEVKYCSGKAGIPETCYYSPDINQTKTYLSAKIKESKLRKVIVEKNETGRHPFWGEDEKPESVNANADSEEELLLSYMQQVATIKKDEEGPESQESIDTLRDAKLKSCQEENKALREQAKRDHDDYEKFCEEFNALAKKLKQYQDENITLDKRCATLEEEKKALEVKILELVKESETGKAEPVFSPIPPLVYKKVCEENTKLKDQIASMKKKYPQEGYNQATMDEIIAVKNENEKLQEENARLKAEMPAPAVSQESETIKKLEFDNMVLKRQVEDLTLKCEEQRITMSEVMERNVELNEKEEIAVLFMEFLSLFQGVKKGNDGNFSAICPAHEDKTQSLSAKEEDGKIILNCFAGCTCKQICQAIGIKESDLFDQKQDFSEGLTVASLATDKKIPEEFLRAIGLVDMDRERVYSSFGKIGMGGASSAVHIPYWDIRGNPSKRQRIRYDKKAKDGSKWSFSDAAIDAYGEWYIAGYSPDILIIVEGESDCWTLWYHGYQAIGIPGATMKNCVKEDVKKFKRIYLSYEKDKAGKKFVQDISKKLSDIGYSGEIFFFKMPEGAKDPNDLHKISKDFRADFQRILEAAMPSKEIEKEKEAKKPEEIQEENEVEESEIETGEVEREIFSDTNPLISFLIAERGIFRKETIRKRKKTFEEIRLVCADKVKITKRLTDIFGEEAFVKIAWDDHEKIVSLDKLSSKNVEMLSKNFGIRVLSTNAKDMSEYFLFCLNQKGLVHGKFASRNGWLKDKFVVGNKVFFEGGCEPIDQKEGALEIGESGSEEEWRKLIVQYSDDPQIQIALGGSLASVFLNEFSCEGTVLHFHQESSVGKSFAIKLAASLWGKPRSLIQDWWGTSVGHETYFHLMNNLPAFLDDSQAVKNPELIFTTVYNYANGVGKTRGTRDVELQKPKNWRGNLLSTGERKVTDTSNYTGMLARAIEIYRKKTKEISEIEFRRIEEVISKNYGFGTRAVQYFFQHRSKLKSHYYDILKSLEESFKVESYKKRNLSKWAAIILGCQVIHDIWGIPYSYNEIWGEIKKIMDEVSVKSSQALYEFILETFYTNPSHFANKTPNGFTRPVNYETIELWGWHDAKIIYFYKEKLREIITKKNYAWSQLSSLKESKDNSEDGSKIVTTKNRGYCLLVRLGGVAYDMIAVKKQDEIVEETKKESAQEEVQQKIAF